MRKISVIIQAKNYTSDSIANRSILKLNGTTILGFIVNKLKNSKFIDKIILATSNELVDDSIVEEAKKYNINIFRGDDKNLIKRFIDCCQKYNLTEFIRVLGNYPLIDVLELDLLVSDYFKDEYQYAYNEHSHGIITGLGADIFKLSCLESINDIKNDLIEIPDLYIKQNFEKFKILKKVYNDNFSSIRLSLETEKDYILIKNIVEKNSKSDLEFIKELYKSEKLLFTINKQFSSKEVGLNKLFLFPDKIKSILTSSNENIVDQSYPISIELSLTNRCNLNCVWCSDKKIRNDYLDDINKEVIFKLIDDLYKNGTKGIVIEGGGEPTLHKDFEEITKYIYEKGLKVGLITNGILLNEFKNIINLFDWIRISLDASTNDEFYKFKGVNKFEKVMKNISEISEFKNTLGIGYVVTNKNYSNLETLVLRLRKLNVDYIQLRPVVDSNDLFPSEIDLSYLLKYNTPQFSVIVDGMNENVISGNNGLPCLCHSLTNVITADGNVYICGRLNKYKDWKPIGNINESDFCDIWVSEERIKQAIKINDGKFCFNLCPECRITKFNILLNNVNKIKTKDFI